jgi:DNA recombination protein RmuC
LIKIGKKMDEAKVEYQGAMNKLTEGKGNLISSVERLKKMGAKAKKAMPEALLQRAGVGQTNDIDTTHEETI